MRLGWRTPAFDSLKLINYTRIENARKVRKKVLFFYCVAVYNYWEDRTDTGLCEPL